MEGLEDVSGLHLQFDDDWEPSPSPPRRLSPRLNPPKQTRGSSRPPQPDLVTIVEDDFDDTQEDIFAELPLTELAGRGVAPTQRYCSSGFATNNAREPPQRISNQRDTAFSQKSGATSTPTTRSPRLAKQSSSHPDLNHQNFKHSKYMNQCFREVLKELFCSFSELYGRFLVLKSFARTNSKRATLRCRARTVLY